VSDGVAFAYLADVFVHAQHRGHSLGKRLVSAMIDEGPGAAFRWMLFTGDAHDLYRQFGFAEPDSTAMVRPARH
jgi:GNAT superfamily N-acetyltransferase